jgi:hypothetical protein
MALGSQVGNLEAITDLTGLVHEIYAGEVKPNVSSWSPTSQLFQEAGAGDYRMDGEKLVFSADLTYAGGAQGSDGNLPDHQYVDAVEGETTPARLYVRRAIDNFIEKRAVRGPGAFGDLLGRMFDQMWDAFGRAQIRHAVGTSNGTLCKVSSRTSSTVFVVKDGYGHADTPPLLHIEPGMILNWVDVNDSNALAGAGTVTAVTYSTNTVTVSTAGTWEPGNNLAANDLIVNATTPNISTDYFASEYTNAPNGLLNIVDPDADATTVFNISQSSYPRWTPYRKASATFDHIEVTEHFRQLRAKSTSPVGPATHVCCAQGAVIAELARTLVGFQQQTQLGRTFEGGYEAVRIAGMDFIEDDWQIHDVLYTLSVEDLFRVDLDGEADYFAEDGSQFSRLADFDGKEWYVKSYLQNFSDRRNRHAALTGITLANVTASDFSPVPS